MRSLTVVPTTMNAPVAMFFFSIRRRHTRWNCDWSSDVCSSDLRVSQALNHGSGKSLSESRILVLGVAYKADISDMRESPAVKLIELLQNAGADVSYHDPHVPSFSEHGTELTSQPLDPAAYDAVVIATAHSGIDYAKLVADARLVVDLRNALGRQGISDEKVWKL